MYSIIFKSAILIILSIVVVGPFEANADSQDFISGIWLLDGESMLEDPEIKKKVYALQKGIEPKIEKTLNVFEVTNPDNDMSTIVSKIIVSLGSDVTLKDLSIIEEIPKSIAMHVDNLGFSHKIEVLQADPIVKWDLGHISKDGVREVSYAVNAELDDIESKTVAGGDKLGMGARFLAWLASLFLK